MTCQEIFFTGASEVGGNRGCSRGKMGSKVFVRTIIEPFHPHPVLSVTFSSEARARTQDTQVCFLSYLACHKMSQNLNKVLIHHLPNDSMIFFFFHRAPCCAPSRTEKPPRRRWWGGGAPVMPATVPPARERMKPIRGLRACG